MNWVRNEAQRIKAEKTPAALVAPGSDYSAQARWGDALRAGFQVVPDVLIRAQRKLGLDALDLVILLNITMHWWRPGDLPYPRPSVIAKRIGVTRRTVERRLERLQRAGFVQRLESEKSQRGLNIRRFDLSGLVQRLQRFAAERISIRGSRESYYTTDSMRGSKDCEVDY